MLCTANPAFMFVTLFVGMLGPEPGTLRFANAGHNDPYRLSPDGKVLTITGTKGHPLGIRDDSTYATEHLSLGRGDSLFVFSDGITEAFDGNGEAFSEVRLQECLRHHTSASAAELVDQVVGAVKAFTADAPQSDDITAMAVRLVSDLP